MGKATILGIIFFCCLFFLIKIVTEYEKYKFFKKKPSIKDVNNLGFTINDKKDSFFYHWRSVKSIKLKTYFSDNKTIEKISLSFKFSDGKKKLNIDSHFTNFYYLLRNIPKGYDLMDYDFAENLFKNLKTCPFCGLVAFYNGECLDCICDLDLYETLKEEYLNIEDYIKDEQLEIFATNDRNEKFNDFKIKSLSFEQDENWKPLVTKQQVLQYSKENCWD